MRSSLLRRLLSGSSLILLSGVAVIPTASAAGQPCGQAPAGYNVIIANEGGETVGTPENDFICGSNGDDVIDGRAGDDIIYGRGGRDTINGRGGNDILYGGKGRDLILGQAGNDTIVGGAAGDTLKGGTGDDIISGGAGNDRLKGGAGADKLNGGKGDDVLNGGGGADILSGGGGSDKLGGGPGTDTLLGGAGSDTITAGQRDIVIGGSGTDTCSAAASGDCENDIEPPVDPEPDPKPEPEPEPDPDPDPDPDPEPEPKPKPDPEPEPDPDPDPDNRPIIEPAMVVRHEQTTGETTFMSSGWANGAVAVTISRDDEIVHEFLTTSADGDIDLAFTPLIEPQPGDSITFSQDDSELTSRYLVEIILPNPTVVAFRIESSIEINTFVPDADGYILVVEETATEESLFFDDELSGETVRSFPFDGPLPAEITVTVAWNPLERPDDLYIISSRQIIE